MSDVAGRILLYLEEEVYSRLDLTKYHIIQLDLELIRFNQIRFDGWEAKQIWYRSDPEEIKYIRFDEVVFVVHLHIFDDVE